ncbi:MFS transporter [Streptomyces sp. DSM 44915]|uniref:MFS transporter n=1 Tax=Streptomyces chisholmiae TaxID=3075540 RepID=A0ABU2JRA9_9ACTN|nr:MFS transporter [Streptomyces sp. DSM 44915]MDT0267291.1 MFS transporter [Streptomyces sp. DSM 44915]
MHHRSTLRTSGIASLLLVTLCCFSGFALLLPVTPAWARHGGADEFGSGLVTAVLMLTTVLAQLALNAVLHRLGWARTLALGALLLGLPALVQALGDELWLILLTTAVRGAGFGVITVCGSIAAAALAPPGRRGAVIGLYGLAIAVPQIVLTPAAPWLVDSFALPAIIACGAVPVLALAGVLPLGRAVEAAGLAGAGDAPQAPRPAAGSAAATLRRVRRPLLLLLLVTTSGGAVLTFTPQFVSSSALAAGALLTFTGPAAVARWAFGTLADRLSPRLLGAVLLPVAGAGLLLVAFALRSDAMSAPALLAGILLLGTAYGGLQTVTLVQALDLAGERSRTTASVAWNIGFDAGTGLGSLLLGFSAQVSSFAMGFAALATVTLTASAALLRPGAGRRG